MKFYSFFLQAMPKAFTIVNYLCSDFNKDRSKCILNSEQEWSVTGHLNPLNFLLQ